MIDSDPTPDPLPFTRQKAHPGCFVCSESNPLGLNLRCLPQKDGSVKAEFSGNSRLEGYPGRLHGGLIASLLDGAMTACLFARGICAVTAELRVRYLDPVSPTEMAIVKAWLESTSHGLHHLRAEIQQNGSVKARATAKFMKPAEGLHLGV